MKHGPIFFTAAMVRALLADTKTQTRRIVKPQPSLNGRWTEWCHKGVLISDQNVAWSPFEKRFPAALSEFRGRDLARLCPYGAPGDRLWVRETMRVIRCRTVDGRFQIRVRYEADDAESDWITVPERLMAKPRVNVAFQPGQCLAYGGFREAWRISLAITSVRVERVQAISEADAIAEGVKPAPDHPFADTHNHRDAFRDLWSCINGVGSWGANPWVWAIEFWRKTP